MGKKNNKNKGKGMEKTILKTEKNASKKDKKSCGQSGEKFIDDMLSDISLKNSKKSPTILENCPPPCPRSCFSIVAHPIQDVLVVFGGEKYLKKTVEFLDELHFFDIQKKQWTQIISPIGPLPRSSHQIVCSESHGGTMWLHGGEFINPTESQFHHFSDLWKFSFSNKIWQEMPFPGAPVARSGHRMVFWQRKNSILIFGGFQMTNSVSRWFNDLTAFDTVHNLWTTLPATGDCPSPRSGVAFAGSSASEDRFFIYGGFCDGHILDELFSVTLQQVAVGKWSAVYSRISIGGSSKPTPRSAFGFCPIGPGRIVIFGGSSSGIQDEDDSENHDDLVVLDATRKKWFLPEICPQTHPRARDNPSLCFKNGFIYLFGGFCESDKHSEMFGDFYCIDAFKLNSWILLVPQSEEAMVELTDSDSSEESMDVSE